MKLTWLETGRQGRFGSQKLIRSDQDAVHGFAFRPVRLSSGPNLGGIRGIPAQSGNLIRQGDDAVTYSFLGGLGAHSENDVDVLHRIGVRAHRRPAAGSGRFNKLSLGSGGVGFTNIDPRRNRPRVNGNR